MSDEARERKEKIAKLKEERKQMEEELDELKGSTGKGKAICVAVFLVAIALLLGIIIALIKTDAGGFASTSLAPVIGDVPIVRSILPKDLQRKTAKELLAEQNAQSDTSATPDTQNAGGSTNPNAAGTNGSNTATSDPNAAGANGTNGATNDPNAATTDPNVAGTNGSNATTSNPNTTDSQAADSQAADSQAADDAAIQDYVQTYTSMRPKNAAQVFDSMMPDQLKLVVKILQNMKPSQRSAILAQMNVQNASDITVEMDKELP